MTIENVYTQPLGLRTQGTWTAGSVRTKPQDDEQDDAQPTDAIEATTTTTTFTEHSESKLI